MPLIYNFHRERERGYSHEHRLCGVLPFNNTSPCHQLLQSGSTTDFNTDYTRSGAKNWAPARHNFWRIQPQRGRNSDLYGETQLVTRSDVHTQSASVELENVIWLSISARCV
jgi:hypothetical protein